MKYPDPNPKRFSLVKDADTSQRLRKIRRRGTSPEIFVRKLLRRLDVRFLVTNPDLPGSPDMANRTQKWAVFVHGCFWHTHRGCPRATIPKRNREFWLAKFAANKARDERARAQLRRMGYSTMAIWECQTLESERLTARIRKALLQVRPKRKS